LDSDVLTSHPSLINRSSRVWRSTGSALAESTLTRFDICGVADISADESVRLHFARLLALLVIASLSLLAMISSINAMSTCALRIHTPIPATLKAPRDATSERPSTTISFPGLKGLNKPIV